MAAHKNRKNKSITDLSLEILRILRAEPKLSFNYKQIASQLGIRDSKTRNRIIKLLKELESRGSIESVSRGKYQIAASPDYFIGTVDMASKGQGYIIVPDLEEDIYVSHENLNRALHGDVVEVYVFRIQKGGRPEGEITRILERKKTEFVGTIERHKNFAFLLVPDSRMYTDIFIPINKLKGARDGEKVLVEMEDWPDRADSPFGKVVKVFGTPGEHQAEIHAILAQYGLPAEFPEEVEEFANAIDTRILDSEIKKRRDMRDVLTFTIDPKDAKDFDDALSFRILENGNAEIGIHIADVSYYMAPGTLLDEEAYERATSIYLVDRVVPMLPEILSNNVCSLRPHEDKYTFSVIFEMNRKAEIVNQWFGRTVSKSDGRFSYEEAQYLIDQENLGKNPDSKQDFIIPAAVSLSGKEYEMPEEIGKSILEMDRLARILRKQRMAKGAISFDKIEVRFNLDPDNEPQDVYFVENKEANKLIEEFMLLANRKVAEFIGKQEPKKTFVYRIHDQPDSEKLAALENIVSRFGYRLNLRDRQSIAGSLNKLLEDVKGKKEQNLVDTLTVRSMSKAVYTTKNIGHYGLSFDYYTHFTSPIRRYPDVMVHRLLQHYLDQGKSVNEKEFEEKCSHCSDMELLAVNAERDSIKYMQVKYMMQHKDKNFLGVISGVTEWGIYVEIISNKCEGMVRIQDLHDDFYTFEREEYAVIGRRTRNVYQLGDEVYIRVKNTDLVKKHLDFSMLGHRKKVEVPAQ